MSDKKFELVDRATERKSQLPVRNGTIGPSVVDISTIQKDLGVFTFDPGFGMTAATELRHAAPHRVLLESEDATFLIQEVGRRAMLVLVVPPERRLSELESAVERFVQAAGRDLG